MVSLLSPCTRLFSSMLEMCSLMLRFESLSAEKCVMESGHPMSTPTSVNDGFCLQPRSKGTGDTVKLYRGACWIMGSLSLIYEMC